MLGGYNNEIMFKGHVFHVQTEDGGIRRPWVRTHIFIKGTIVAMLEDSYEPLLAVTHLDKVVRSIMQGQHKAIIRRLIRGEFNDQVSQVLGCAFPPATPVKTPSSVPAPQQQQNQPPAAQPRVAQPVIDLGDGTDEELSLDDLILKDLKQKDEL